MTLRVSLLVMVAMSTASGLLFSSIAKLESLAKSELQILEKLNNVLPELQAKTDVIRSYVDTQRSLLATGATEAIAHPIGAFVFLRRLVTKWGQVFGALEDIANVSAEIRNSAKVHMRNSNFPRNQDVMDAIEALLQLQDTYNLDIKAISRGTLISGDGIEFGAAEGVELSQDDMLLFGSRALHLGLSARGSQWIRTANNPAAELSKSPPVAPAPKLLQPLTELEEADQFKRLCRGERFLSPAAEASLKCRLHRKRSGFMILAPVKLEEASLNPYIVLFHDFVTPAQVSRLKDLAAPKLRTAKVVNTNGEKGRNPGRISQMAWVPDYEDTPLLAALNRRVEEATGFRAQAPDAGEEWQVAQYGLGGVFVPHTDYFSGFILGSTPPAQRLATLMIYLSDVGAGGATVFPQAGVSVHPQKGSAVFWWNLNRDGLGDINTSHGGCPVLQGSKWVANKWILQRGQFQRAEARCELEKDKLRLD